MFLFFYVSRVCSEIPSFTFDIGNLCGVSNFCFNPHWRILLPLISRGSGREGGGGEKNIDV